MIAGQNSVVSCCYVCGPSHRSVCVYLPLLLLIQANDLTGSVVSAVSPTYLVDEMAHAMKVCCPKILVVDKASYIETLKAARILGIPEASFICIESVAELPSRQDLISKVKGEGRIQQPK